MSKTKLELSTARTKGIQIFSFKLVFLCVFIFVSPFFVFSQGGRFEQNQLKQKDTIFSKNIFKKISSEYDLTFVMFTPAEDSAKVNIQIKKNKFNLLPEGINFFYYTYVPPKFPQDCPYFNKMEIQGDQCYILTYNSGFCSDIKISTPGNQDISLESLPIPKNENTFINKLSINGICTPFKVELYANKLSEFYSLYKEKYLLQARGLTTAARTMENDEIVVKTLKNTIDSLSKTNSYLNELINGRCNYISFIPSFNNGQNASISKNSLSQQYETKLSSRQGFGFGVNFHRYFASKKAKTKDSKPSKLSNGIGIGINFQRNDLSLSSDKVYFNYSAIDKDGTQYYRRIYGTNIKEAVSLNFMELPVYYIFNYKLGKKEKVSIAINAGLKISYMFSGTYHATDGVLSYRGKYDGISNEFINMNDYNFYENQPIIKTKQNLETKEISYGCFIAPSIKFKLAQNLDLAIGASFMLAQSNLLKSNSDDYIISDNKDEYKSLLFSLDKYKTNPVSFNLGLTFKF